MDVPLNAIDGDNKTIWQTQWYSASPQPPHEIVIWLGGNYIVGGFTYLPRQDGSLDGTVAKYSFYVSADGVNWGNPVANGTFAKNANKKKVLFAGRAGQFVRFVAKSEVNGKPWTSAAEIRVLGTPVAVPALVEVPQSQMSVVFVDSEELTGEDGSADNAIDGDPNTFWHTEWYTSSPEHPHKLDIALGGTYEVWGIELSTPAGWVSERDRDEVYDLCQYGWREVGKDGSYGALTKDTTEKNSCS